MNNVVPRLCNEVFQNKWPMCLHHVDNMRASACITPAGCGKRPGAALTTTPLAPFSMAAIAAFSVVQSPASVSWRNTADDAWPDIFPGSHGVLC